MHTLFPKYGQRTVRLFMLVIILSLWIPTTTVFSQGTVVLNEIQVSTDSTDWEFFEVTGTPGTGLSNLTLLVIESDNGTSAGQIDRILNLSGAIPDDGFWWAASATGQAIYGGQCGTADGSFSDNTFENSTTTYLLVEGFAGALNQDLDTDDDGVLDLTPWSALVDGVGIRDSGTTDFTYGGVPSRGPDGSFLPSGLYRNPDAGAWANDFLNFSSPDGTPGASNLGICEPPPPSEPTIAFIHEVQGTGSSVVSPGAQVTVQAIVVGDFSADNQLDGFFIQEENVDAALDPNGVAASDGIFVYCGNNNCGSFPTIQVGDLVTVTGAQEEFFGLSQLDAEFGSIVVNSSNNLLPAPASIDLPAAGNLNTFYEPFEGMLVNFVDSLVVSEYFELARFGEVVLYQGQRPFQYTHFDDTPTQAEFDAYQANLDSRRVILDDDNSRQNSALPNGVFYYPQPGGFSISNFFRGGDTVSNLTGILGYTFGEYHVLPVDPEFTVQFTATNPRPAAPASAGDLTVASFNVLNYFLTVDTTSSSSSGVCGASQTLDCRGADSQAEVDRQTDKLVSALLELDADVYGLIEMENTPDVEPLQHLVNAMNAVVGAGTYDFVDSGVIGGDAIRVGIIYRATSVSPAGVHAVLDTEAFLDPNNTGAPKNRPALAQTFTEDATGAVFTVVVNHLKSKGSGCGAGDDDPFQASCNLTRTLAAQELVAWLATDPTGSNDNDILIIGDLNAYASEDPIAVLEFGGNGLSFTDLLQALGGADSYSYVFDGQLGYLDYALASDSLLAQVEDIAEWHINADEVNVLDYNDDVRDAGERSFEEKPDGNLLYEANPFRTSDHDPVVVGLNLIPPLVADAGGPYATDEGSNLLLNASATNTNGAVTYLWDLDDDGLFETEGKIAAIVIDDGPVSLPIALQVCDASTCATDSTTIEVSNVAPSTALNVLPSPPLFQGETVTLYLGPTTDPSTADTDAGFTFDVDCDAQGQFTAQTVFNCMVPNVSTWTIQGFAQDKDGGIGTATLTDLEVLTTDAAITYVIGEVEATDGLNAGQTNALVSKLEAARQQLSQGNKSAALNQLNAFVNQVASLQAEGILSSDDAQYLTVLANRLMQSIINS